MVELRPVTCKLSPKLADAFLGAMQDICHRFVDVIERSKEEDIRFMNGPASVSFELRRPTTSDLSMLACIAARLKPDEIDFMHAHGDHCIIYWMQWTAPEKEKQKDGDSATETD